jgi:hypothetical protein
VIDNCAHLYMRGRPLNFTVRLQVKRERRDDAESPIAAIADNFPARNLSHRCYFRGHHSVRREFAPTALRNLSASMAGVL